MNNDRQHTTAQFPQFRVISSPNFIEYRVYAFDPRDKSLGVGNFVDACWIGLVSYALYTVRASSSQLFLLLSHSCKRSQCEIWSLCILTGLFVLYGYWRCTSIVYGIHILLSKYSAPFIVLQNRLSHCQSVVCNWKHTEGSQLCLCSL